MNPMRANARVLFAAMSGTAIEYYDFFIYGTAAALVFGPLFFPSESPAAQTMFALMSFALAFVARPVGAAVFGHFGDRIGRKSSLVFSLLLMGGATLAIAFLPTYAMIGWVAPALLCVLRFCQGFGLAGEWSGAALLAVEYAPPGWETRHVAAMQMGAPIGLFCATGVFMAVSLSLSEADFAAWGWRLPFLLSALLVAIGLWVRLRIEETPVFRKALEQEAPERVPLAEVLRRHPGGLLAGSAGVMATFVAFYLVTAWALAEGTGPQGLPRNAFLASQMLASVFYGVAMVIGAVLSDRTSPGQVLGRGALAVAVSGLFFGPGLASGDLLYATAAMCLSMFALGFANGPLGAWLAPLFPVKLRYSGVAMAFNFGGLVGGAVTPLWAQQMSGAGHGLWVGALMAGGGVCTWLATRLARPAA